MNKVITVTTAAALLLFVAINTATPVTAAVVVQSGNTCITLKVLDYIDTRPAAWDVSVFTDAPYAGNILDGSPVVESALYGKPLFVSGFDAGDITKYDIGCTIL